MKKNSIQKIISLLLICVLILSGCGGKSGSSEKVEALKETNEIPEDGIITKEQFKTIAGEDMDVQFTGSTESGIIYTWIFHADQIQNPQDQNLKIDFSEDNLEEIKKNANNAIDALKMTMQGKGIIAVPTLTITYPGVWESDTGMLVKEQGDKLARISDVTIVTEGEGETGTTTLTMTVTTLDGDSYIVGGIAEKEAEQKASEEKGTTAEDAKTNDNSNTTDDTSKSTESKGKDVKTQKASHVCTISINCATLLDNLDVLPEEKHEFVPADGVILAASEVEFEEGESAHDILKRVCKAAGIHMESTYTPVYDSAYVEGINQLYEFDGGELSGWMYKVNGWFPNYGVSKYEVSDGDVIEFVYTCNLGKDVGDNSMY